MRSEPARWAPTLGLQPPAVPASAALVVARGAGHDLRTLERAKASGAAVGAAVRISHRRLEVGPARRGPLDRRERLTLGELLAAAGPATRLMLDIRGLDPRLPRLLALALGGRRAEPVLVAARSWASLDVLRGHPCARLVPIVTSARQLSLLMRRCDTDPLDGVAVAADLLDARSVAALRAMTDLLLAWPVDSPAESERLRSLGVTGLISDRPGLVSGRPAGLAA